MGRRGPIPMSDSVRIARGARTSGRLRKNWTPPVAVPAMPDVVAADPDAARKWNEFANVLLEQGTIAAVDRNALALLVLTWVRWMRVLEHVRRHGERCVESKIATELGKDVRAMLDKFALTPAGRRRLHVGEAMLSDAPADPADAVAARLLNPA